MVTSHNDWQILEWGEKLLLFLLHVHVYCLRKYIGLFKSIEGKWTWTGQISVNSLNIYNKCFVTCLPGTQPINMLMLIILNCNEMKFLTYIFSTRGKINFCRQPVHETPGTCIYVLLVNTRNIICYYLTICVLHKWWWFIAIQDISVTIFKSGSSRINLNSLKSRMIAHLIVRILLKGSSLQENNDRRNYYGRQYGLSLSF